MYNGTSGIQIMMMRKTFPGPFNIFFYLRLPRYVKISQNTFDKSFDFYFLCFGVCKKKFETNSLICAEFRDIFQIQTR